jgi:threonine dehydrogenase-like Zn-dependent dehydrogenase
VEYDFNLGQGREITIKQNSHFDNDDLARLCSLVAEGKIKIAPLIQEVIPASDCKRIYDTLRDNPMELGGTVFDWQNL